ncbi:MAG TPA: serine/threonine-protein kinase [Polyangia bacterium]|jgi:tRNA A-37 threonylcarbamoyl transferase component Bud32
MANRWNVTAAILGAGAIGVAGLTAGLLVVDRHSATALFALQTGDEATKLAASVGTVATRAMKIEVASAAALPQLRAAVRNRVDAATMEDLFATEEWWGPYRDRSVALVTASKTLVSHPMHQILPDTDLVSRARAEGAVAEIKQSAGQPTLAGAVVMEEVPGNPVLSLTRPIDTALVSEWARSAGTSLAITDGQRLIAASDTEIGKIPLVGHERDAAFPSDGRFVVAPSALGAGLWLWGERALPPAPDARVWMWGLVALCAAGAALLALLGKRSAPAAAPSSSFGLPAVAQVPATFVDPYDARIPDRLGVRPLGTKGPALTASGTLRKFGRYELVERIGEGGMSDIYAATMRGAKGFERLLVVKRLKRELSSNHAAVEQFIDEARLGSLLSHPNIVQVHDFGEADDGYFMALEYVPGRNLTQIVERHLERFGRALDLPTVFYLIHDVLQALAYAHDRTNANGAPLGIVHRDVSPSNIMISTRGEVKLLDFGIVKAEDRLSRSDIANVKGNPAFMAPEQARGGSRVDSRADLFSLGLVMYHALTGELVYRGATAGETLFHAATGPTREEMEHVLAMPEPAARVLERALATEAEDRYQTAEEFASAVAPQIRTGARVSLGALMHNLFGAELRSESGTMAAVVERSTPVRPRAS